MTTGVQEKVQTEKKRSRLGLLQKTEDGKQDRDGYICGICRKLPYAPTEKVDSRIFCLCSCHYPPVKLEIRNKK